MNTNHNDSLFFKNSVLKLCKVMCLFLPIIAMHIQNAFAAAIDLDAGAKSFFVPVVKVITDYSSTAIFASGIVAGLAAPGDLRMRFGACAGGMVIAGLVVLAGKKMLGIA